MVQTDHRLSALETTLQKLVRSLEFPERLLADEYQVDSRARGLQATVQLRSIRLRRFSVPLHVADHDHSSLGEEPDNAKVRRHRGERRLSRRVDLPAPPTLVRLTQDRRSASSRQDLVAQEDLRPGQEESRGRAAPLDL